MRISESYSKKLGSILTAVLCLAVFPVFSLAGNFDPDQDVEKSKLIDGYTAHLEMVDKEIISLTENLEWLKIKIQEIRHSDKPVPVHMTASAAYKEKRISVLNKTRDAVVENLERINTAYPDTLQHKAMVPAKRFSSPDLDHWFEMVAAREGKVVFRTKSPVRFASGSAAIEAGYTPMLKDISAVIKSFNPWVVVDGFADTDPIKNKRFPSNFELGTARAANIVHSLVGYGADPSRFKVSSTGKYRFPQARPMSENKEEERYVNITLLLEEN